MKCILLSQGKVAWVDDRDFHRTAKYKWYAYTARKEKPNWYAVRQVSTGLQKPKQKTIIMHRFILGLVGKQKVDHWDGNGLNNQRANLRRCRQLQNSRNRAKTIHKTSSRFKGVSWNKHCRKWQASVSKAPGNLIYLGLFSNELQAAKTYDRAARRYHGRFARLNFSK